MERDQAIEDLKSKRCQPCEGGVPRIERAQAETLLASLPGWSLDSTARIISRKWKLKDFVSGLAFVRRIGDLAEEENHHPDLHLTGYRHVTVELTTHAIEGLSENDFILAAKIDDLPTGA